MLGIFTAPITETGCDAYSRTDAVTCGSLTYFCFRASSINRSTSCGVCPATPRGPINGSEIIPEAETLLVPLSPGSSNTETSIKASDPIRYSFPEPEVGVLEGRIELKSSCGRGTGTTGRSVCPQDSTGNKISQATMCEILTVPSDRNKLWFKRWAVKESDRSFVFEAPFLF